ncbi:hypothetical protein BRADI_2g19942v3 [Brachypodium distachyon]|uniref:Uncharacterized protein n=1 Tax=Brachypodium distachyon TaxID=15368 RepID=A0A2K2D9G8_BRADI|nr:hypothetical protein BRADI_2g19942v3 [Brachypodium distachyon]
MMRTCGELYLVITILLGLAFVAIHNLQHLFPDWTELTISLAFGLMTWNMSAKRMIEGPWEDLYAFPTLLPCVNENVTLSQILPLQRDSTLASRVLKVYSEHGFERPPSSSGWITLESKSYAS